MAHTYKDMFVVSGEDGTPIYKTISYWKKYSIESFLKGSKMTWKYCYKLGYRCRKYDVQFTLKQK